MYVTNAGYDATYCDSQDECIDECIEREEDSYGRELRCGGYRVSEWGENTGCQGCRQCFPPDTECQPYGYGFFVWEDAARLAAGAAKQGEWRGGPYKRLPVPDCEVNAAKDAATFRLRRRMNRAAWCIWTRICDGAETHAVAVKQFKTWAAAAVAKMTAHGWPYQMPKGK